MRQDRLGRYRGLLRRLWSQDDGRQLLHIATEDVLPFAVYQAEESLRHEHLRRLIKDNPIEEGRKGPSLTVKQLVQSKACSAQDHIGCSENVSSIVHIRQRQTVFLLGERQTLPPFQAAPWKIFDQG